MRRNYKDFLLHKDKALALAKERLGYFNAFYRFDIEQLRIRIKNQRARWGSYSRKGTMNFNYRIVRLPQQFADSIIVHELCHIGEFNHSRRFWDLVLKTIPDYRKLDRELNKNSIAVY